MVSSAGSEGSHPVFSSATYKEVIAVSATDQDDDIAGFSSRGPEVEIAAPGDRYSVHDPRWEVLLPRKDCL